MRISLLRGFMLSSASLVAVLAAAGQSPAAAQQQTPTQSAQRGGVSIEEIVVTARKREESLQEIPIAITAFSAEQLQQQQIFDMRDVTRLSPGLTFQSVGGNGGGGRFNSVVIFRGMTFAAPLPRLQTGAVFVDGLYVLGGTASVNTSDVERVEVIKGPQNAYFGRNTFGGAVNFITKNPNMEKLAGSLDLGVATYETVDANASVNGPILQDKLSVRVAALYRQKGGHYTSLDGRDLGDEKTKSITGTVYAQPSENFWLRLRGHYQEDDDGPPAWGHLSGAQNGSLCPGVTFRGLTANGQETTFPLSQRYFCGTVPTLKSLPPNFISTNTRLDSPLFASFGTPNAIRDALNNALNDPLVARAPKLKDFGMKREVIRFNAQAEWEFADGFNLGVNFGYNKNDTIQLTDPDRSSAVENAYTIAPALFEDKAIEVRLFSGADQRFRWMIGGNYYQGDFDAHTNGQVLYQNRTLPTQAIPRAFTIGVPPNRDGERAKVYAGFASVDFDLFDNLTLTGEIRYQKDTSKLQPSNAASQQVSFKDWLPRVIVNYKPTEDWTLYGSWSRGVLPGNINTGFTNLTAFQQQQVLAAIPNVQPVVPSEKLDSYEIGSKQTLFDGRLQYTLAAYFMKWNNIKSSSFLTIPPTSGAQPTFLITGVTTRGAAKLYGFEFESTFQITDQWDVNFRVNLQESEYTDIVSPALAQLTSNVVRFDGNRLARTPLWTGSISSSYVAPAFGDWEWFLRGEVTYTGKSWESEANLAQLNDFFRANARIGLQKENLSLEFYVKNIFNDKNWDYGFRSVSFREPGSIQVLLPPPVNAFGFVQGIIVQPPEKRVFGLRARYTF
jgi:iron complex outermembrane receptor protein